MLDTGALTVYERRTTRMQYGFRRLFGTIHTGHEPRAMLPQVKYLMGLKIPRFDRLQDTCSSLVANLNYFNWREYVVSALLAEHKRLHTVNTLVQTALDQILVAAQMGMSFIIILEVFKFVGRKHKCVLCHVCHTFASQDMHVDISLPRHDAASLTTATTRPSRAQCAAFNSFA